MQRTVVYSAPSATGATVQGVPSGSAPAADKYADKLVKYLPAEVIAFFVPGYALVQQAAVDWVQWVVVILGLFGTVGYLMVRADRARPPRRYFYVLAGGAYLVWAAGTSTFVPDLLPVAAETWKPLGAFAIMAGVFVIPLIDELVSRYLKPS